MGCKAWRNGEYKKSEVIIKDKQLEVIEEKIKLIESVKNIEATEVTDVDILKKIKTTSLFRIDKENEVKNDIVF